MTNTVGFILSTATMCPAHQQVTFTHTHCHFMTLCPDLPRWASTRRDIHPLTPETCRGSLSSFWILWGVGKITEASAPTIRLDATPSRLSMPPPPPSTNFTLDALLPQPSQFILAWDRHKICWIAHLEAWLTSYIQPLENNAEIQNIILTHQAKIHLQQSKRQELSELQTQPEHTTVILFHVLHAHPLALIFRIYQWMLILHKIYSSTWPLWYYWHGLLMFIVQIQSDHLKRKNTKLLAVQLCVNLLFWGNQPNLQIKLTKQKNWVYARPICLKK